MRASIVGIVSVAFSLGVVIGPALSASGQAQTAVAPLRSAARRRRRRFAPRCISVSPVRRAR